MQPPEDFRATANINSRRAGADGGRITSISAVFLQAWSSSMSSAASSFVVVVVVVLLLIVAVRPRKVSFARRAVKMGSLARKRIRPSIEPRVAFARDPDDPALLERIFPKERRVSFASSRGGEIFHGDRMNPRAEGWWGYRRRAEETRRTARL